MDAGSYDVGSYLKVPLHNSSYEILSDPFLKTLEDDPYATIAPFQVYLLEILSAFAIVLVLPSLFWHARNRNLPASCLAFWTIWLNFMNLVNALIWPTDYLADWFWGQGLCDIAVKMDVGSMLGIIGAVICILRALARALNTQRIRLVPSRAELVRQRAIECLFCIGLPILAAIVHIFVQSRRYYIYAISGCMYTVGETWLDVLLLWMWPPFFALVAAYYAATVALRVMKYRREFSSVLSASSSGLSKSRFSRLFAISSVVLLVYLPIEIYVFVWNVTLTPLGPYSWSDIHSPSTWDYLLFFPAYGQIFFDRWIYASLGYVLFLTLGLGADAAQFWRKFLLGLGFGGIFPSLNINPDPTKEQSSSTQSSAAKTASVREWISTFGSRSRLLGSKRSSQQTRSDLEKGSDVSTTNHSSARSRHSHALSDDTFLGTFPMDTLSELTVENGCTQGARD